MDRPALASAHGSVMQHLKRYFKDRDQRHLEDIQRIVDRVRVPLELRVPMKDGIPYRLRFFPTPKAPRL